MDLNGGTQAGALAKGENLLRGTQDRKFVERHDRLCDEVTRQIEEEEERQVRPHIHIQGLEERKYLMFNKHGHKELIRLVAPRASCKV